MADAADLKSVAAKAACGFDPRSGYFVIVNAPQSFSVTQQPQVLQVDRDRCQT